MMSVERCKKKRLLLNWQFGRRGHWDRLPVFFFICLSRVETMSDIASIGSSEQYSVEYALSRHTAHVGMAKNGNVVENY